MNVRLSVLIGVAMFFVIISAVVSVLVLGDVAEDGCLRDYATIEALRTIIERSKETIEAYHNDGLLTDKQYIDAQANNARALGDLRLPSC